MQEPIIKNSNNKFIDDKKIRDIILRAFYLHLNSFVWGEKSYDFSFYEDKNIIVVEV